MKGHLFLLGFMGSGKSRWGLQLANYLRRPFLDLDHLITASEQQSVAEIFTERGENGFRDLERTYLHQLTNQPDSVVSLGGGTPCFFDNMEWINQNGQSIYLKVPLDVLIGRLERNDGQRPILALHPKEEWPKVLGEMLERRESFYKQARYIVEYTGDDQVFFDRLCLAAQIKRQG